MSHDLLPCVEIEPAGEARSAVLWMHGLGADGHDFEPIIPWLKLPDDLGVRFVFPNAPRRAVTINMGLLMPAWYDIRDPSFGRNEDTRGILDSSERIGALVRREIERGIPARALVLAGFSQGGAMALHVGLRHAEPLAGVLAMSCYLVRDAALDAELSPAVRGMSIFQAHGADDPMVPLRRGEEARDRLLSLGFQVDWHAFPMGHQVIPEEIEAAGAWLRRVLAPAVRGGAAGD